MLEDELYTYRIGKCDYSRQNLKNGIYLRMTNFKHVE